MFKLERLFPDIVCFSSNSLISYIISYQVIQQVMPSPNKWCRHVVGCQVEKNSAYLRHVLAFLGSNSSEPTVAVSQGGGDMLLLRFQKFLGDDLKNPYHFEGRVWSYGHVFHFFLCTYLLMQEPWPVQMPMAALLVFSVTGHCNKNDWSSGGQLIINRVINPSWGIRMFFSPQSCSYLYFILFIVVVVVVVFVLVVWLWLACCATALWL